MIGCIITFFLFPVNPVFSTNSCYLQSKNILQEDGFISIESLLGSVYNELYSQADMLIDLYGINYDGINYHIKKEKFTTENFKLLAYTLQDKDVIEAFQRRKNDKV